MRSFCFVLTCGLFAQTAVLRPPIVGVAHVALRTNDIAAARTFYGHALGFAEPCSAVENACFKVNDRQYIEVYPELTGDAQDRLIDIAFETTDVHQLRDYLASRGVKVPDTIAHDRGGDLSFQLTDPDGHLVEFVQYLPGSIHSRNFGKHLSATRVSDHMLHAGVRVVDPVKADGFYKDILGFRLQWKGGRNGLTEWISMMVPDGYDWVEYMVAETTPSPQQLGVLNHYALGTLDIHKAYQTVVERGYKPASEPNIAVDGRWLLQLYDRNYTRTELMIRKPVQTPCCSPNLDDFKQ